ncbi:MAG: replication-relaxation family protein [Prevotella sp.]|jgi:DNA-binding PadR family transcriptional regulator|nr:replication-relaxation family protein [Prevotella sp.]
MILINNLQSDILENLGKFKFLTTSQIKQLTNKSLSYIRENLSLLSQNGYIKTYRMEKFIKAENMYYLTEKGKEILISHEKVFADNIKVPVGVPLVVKDFQHRKNFIDIHIAVYRYLEDKETQIYKFYAYFDKTGNNRTTHNLESKTKISLGDDQFFMPDGILITTNENDDKNMYLVEMYNGKDTIRTLQQLAKHGRAIALGTPAQKFRIQKNPYILCVFEYESSKQAVIKRLQANERFMPLADFFFFASLDDMQKDFILSWYNLNGKELVFN